MRIIQLRSGLNYGDGIGNSILEMDKVLARHYETIIAVRTCDNRIQNTNIVLFQNVDELMINPNDIIIFHFAGHDDLELDVLTLCCKRIMLYHNITYPFFFYGVDKSIFHSCAEGQRYIRNALNSFVKIIVPSEFSRDELVKLGGKKDDVVLLPLPVALNQYNKADNKKRHNVQFLYVGRIVPNKKIEDVIRTYEYYKNHYDRNTCLKLVGSLSRDAYSLALKRYIQTRGIENVEFLNHVSDEELNSLYDESDVYICMSEHEGFCMPLIEAMNHGLPVVAYNATAIPDTMGDAGVLLESKNLEYVCERIHRVLIDDVYRKELIENQYMHIKQFIRDDYEEKLLKVISEVQNKETFSYDDSKVEFYRLFLDEIEENARRDLMLQFKRLIYNGTEIVICGCGKIGKQLVDFLKEKKIPVAAICDAKQFGTKYGVYEILPIDKCVDIHSEAIYIISVQNDEMANCIERDLVQRGISPRNIIFYRNQEKTLCI